MALLLLPCDTNTLYLLVNEDQDTNHWHVEKDGLLENVICFHMQREVNPVLYVTYIYL